MKVPGGSTLATFWRHEAIVFSEMVMVRLSVYLKLTRVD